MDWPTPTGRVVITGGTGFLGSELARHLDALGCDVVRIGRHDPRDETPGAFEQWDGRTTGPWVQALDGANAVVNLAGRTVDCIKTPDHCDEILRSRVDATRAVGEALKAVDQRPPVWVQMSTAHIYGDPPVVRCDEEAAFGYGLAPTVGKAWEAEFARHVPNDVRPVVLRTSFVLGRDGGALSRLAKLARFGLGGTVGSGEQGMSWIHLTDMNRLFERAITDESMTGAYIATAPNPVSNRVFMRSLRQAIGMPIGLPAAAWMVRLGAPLVLRTDPELALFGRYCASRRLEEEGFDFRFPDLNGALADLFTT